MANQRLNLAVVFRGKLIPVYICHTVIVASKLPTTYWEWRPRGGLNFSSAHKHADVRIAQEFTWKEETMMNQYAAGGIECLQMTREHKRTHSSCVQSKTSHMWGSLGIYFYIRKKKEIKTLLFFCRNRHGNSMVHTKSISIRGNVAGWTSAFDIEQKKADDRVYCTSTCFHKDWFRQQ